MDKLEFPADMPEDVRRMLGTPTADNIRAWNETRHLAPVYDLAKALTGIALIQGSVDALTPHIDAQHRLADGARAAAGATGATGARKGDGR